MPAAPDPYQTADAQNKMNINTGRATQAMNMVNQVTPDYNLTYDQTGTRYVGGGETIPTFTAKTELSPANQQIYNTTQGTKQNLATIGNEQSAAVRNILNTPFDFNDASDSRYEQMARTRLDPQWAERAQQNEQSLIDRGLRPGTPGYESAMRTFNQGRNDAYNSLYTTGKGLFDQEALTQRNQPLNEISALMSGSQIAQPNFINTPQTQVAGTNLGGMVYDSYNAENQAAQAQMGGLFGLGGSVLGLGMKAFKPF